MNTHEPIPLSMFSLSVWFVLCFTFLTVFRSGCRATSASQKIPGSPEPSLNRILVSNLHTCSRSSSLPPSSRPCQIVLYIYIVAGKRVEDGKFQDHQNLLSTGSSSAIYTPVPDLHHYHHHPGPAGSLATLYLHPGIPFPPGLVTRTINFVVPSRLLFTSTHLPTHSSSLSAFHHPDSPVYTPGITFSNIFWSSINTDLFYHHLPCPGLRLGSESET
ncbi:uncharacterized protein LOC120567705 [Perca fluviatilis]|uniref:uncharacterized protein LOC120567705 n=1 Tax=Perca fluviatilis TaxID=8168 RepID=UPI001962302D|nr:uncharacterized protein LOC120567705 [Perca fluviatilis]